MFMLRNSFFALARRHRHDPIGGVSVQDSLNIHLSYQVHKIVRQGTLRGILVVVHVFSFVQ